MSDKKSKQHRKQHSRNEDRTRVSQSKFMTFVLRHGADKKGIAMASDGSVAVKDLLDQKEMKGVTQEQLEIIVRECPKQRFQFLENNTRIRASQGHTMKKVKEEALLTPIVSAESFPVVVHGTNRKAYQLIQTEGLSRMQRNHIHFATGLPSDDHVKSGMRQSSSVFIYLNLKKCIEDNIPFFISANGVILSPGIGDTGVIPPRYFSKVDKRH
eukprot:m.240299 g.240299  ORF g.240299 m.240299 type:complete len:213 (+) comp14839_c0_seq1:234-872(+)